METMYATSRRLAEISGRNAVRAGRTEAVDVGPRICEVQPLPALFHSAGGFGKAVRSVLIDDPPDHTAVVVNVTDDVIQSGKAARLAGLLHFGELAIVELR